MKHTQHLALGAALFAMGCASAPPRPSSPPARGARDESAAATARLTDDVDECETLVARTDHALTDAIHLIDPEATGRKKPSELMTEVRATGVEVWIELTTDDAPLPTVKDALLAEGRKLPNPSRTPEDAARLRDFARRSDALQGPLGPLRSQVIALGRALSLDGPVTCRRPLDTATRSLAEAAVRGEAPAPEYAALHRRLVDATVRSEAIGASTIALMATYAAAFAGRDPTAIDRLAIAVRESLADARLRGLDGEETSERRAVPDAHDAPQTTAAHVAARITSATSVTRANDERSSPSAHLYEGVRALKGRDFAAALDEATKTAPPGPLREALRRASGPRP